MTFYELPSDIFLLYACKISLINNTRKIDLNNYKKYEEFLLGKVSNFANKNFYFLPRLIQLPVVYVVGENSLEKALENLKGIITLENGYLKISEDLTLEQINQLIEKENIKDRTNSFAGYFYSDEEGLDCLELTSYKNDIKELEIILTTMEQLFQKSNDKDNRKQYRKYRRLLQSKLKSISQDENYLKLIYKRLKLADIEMPNVYDIEDSGKPIYSEFNYAIFSNESLFKSKLKLLLDKIYDSAHSNDESDFEPEENVKYIELTDVKLHLIFIYIKNALEYLEEHPDKNIEKTIKRLLFLFDSEETPLLSNKDIETTFNNIDISSTHARINNDLSSSFYDDIYTNYFEMASTFIDNIFQTDEPNDVKLKLLILKSVFELLDDEELKDILKENRDHPNFKEYYHFILPNETGYTAIKK